MKGSWARRFFGIMRPPPLSSLHRVCRGVSDRSRPMSFLHGHSTSVIHSASLIATAQTRSCSKVAVVAQLRQNILNKLDSNELGFGRYRAVCVSVCGVCVCFSVCMCVGCVRMCVWLCNERLIIPCVYKLEWHDLRFANVPIGKFRVSLRFLR